jgi:hypothetical protein
MYKKNTDKKRATGNAFFFVEEITGLQKSTIRKILYKTGKYIHDQTAVRQRASILPRIEYIAKILTNIYTEQINGKPACSPNNEKGSRDVACRVSTARNASQ